MRSHLTTLAQATAAASIVAVLLWSTAIPHTDTLLGASVPRMTVTEALHSNVDYLQTINMELIARINTLASELNHAKEQVALHASNAKQLEDTLAEQTEVGCACERVSLNKFILKHAQAQNMLAREVSALVAQLRSVQTELADMRAASASCGEQLASAKIETAHQNSAPTVSPVSPIDEFIQIVSAFPADENIESVTKIAYVKTHKTGSSSLGSIFLRAAARRGLKLYKTVKGAGGMNMLLITFEEMNVFIVVILCRPRNRRHSVSASTRATRVRHEHRAHVRGGHLGLRFQ
jgi:hypothetical protein